MLVLDTDVARDFFEVLEKLGPSDSVRVVRFVNEVVKTLKATENRVKGKEMEIECLMRSLDEIEEKAQEDSAYEEEDDEGKGSFH